jgi:hypothetical protein
MQGPAAGAKLRSNEWFHNELAFGISLILDFQKHITIYRDREEEVT